jgi:hypothetical protein
MPGITPIDLRSNPHDLSENDVLDRIVRLESLAVNQGIEVSSLLSSRKTWRWAIGLGAPTLIGVFVTVMLDARSQVVSSSEHAGRTEARLEALDRALDRIEKAQDRRMQDVIDDIRALRLEMHKITGHPLDQGISVVRNP